MGLAVDYLVRYMVTNNAEDAFVISYLGAARTGKEKIASKLISNIKGLDNKSIICACRLSGFDVCFRVSVSGYKPSEEIRPDIATINIIRIMVERSLSFLRQYGPIKKAGVTFEGGYTDTVSSGDGDYVTSDTIWDFKVSKNELTSKHTLQLLVYYIIGTHSVHTYFNQIHYLGIWKMNGQYV